MPDFDYTGLPKTIPTPQIDYSSMPKIDYSAMPQPEIKPMVNLPEVVKSGVGDMWGGLGNIWEKANTPMLPDVEEDIINASGKVPLVGPLTQKITDFVVRGSSSPLGVGTLGTAALLGKTGLSAYRTLKGSTSVAPKVSLPRPLTMEQALNGAIEKAKPIRDTQKNLFSIERGKRAREFNKRFNDLGGGEGAFHISTGKLKGELPREPFESVRGQFNQDNIDMLYQKINSAKIPAFDKATAGRGLDKLLDGGIGDVPQAAELKILEKLFPGLSKSLADKKKFSPVVELGNASRTIMSSGDVTSFPGRQGGFLVGRNTFWKSVPKGVKAVTKKNYDEAMQSVFKSPHYDLGQQYGKLAITDMNDINLAEESFSSKLANLPGIRNSAQAYTANANTLRQSTFDSLIELAKKQGRDVDPKSAKFDNKLVEEIGSYVNNATGRGDLPENLERSARLLNATLFSPRLIASRMNLLKRALVDPLKAPANAMLKATGGTPYERIDPLVRKEYWKDFFKFAGAQAAILGTTKLAQLGGADVTVGDEPTSTDYGKVKIGNARLDFNGGFQQYFRAAAQLAQQQVTSSVSGKRTKLEEGYKPKTSYDVIHQLFESKESPMLSFISNFLKGQDLAGQDVTLSSEMGNKLTPIIMQDLKEIMLEDPKLLWALIPANFGAGLQVYGPQNYKKAEKANPYEVRLPKF